VFAIRKKPSSHKGGGFKYKKVEKMNQKRGAFLGRLNPLKGEGRKGPNRRDPKFLTNSNLK